MAAGFAARFFPLHALQVTVGGMDDVRLDDSRIVIKAQNLPNENLRSY
jgi:hypothetical protein